MDTGGCAAAAPAHRVLDLAAAPAPVGAKKRPHMTDGGWTGTKKNRTPCSREYQQVQGLELDGGGSGGEANATAVVRSRKRSYEYGSELELDVASASQKLFKCNYWEDPAYAKSLEYFGLTLARSAAQDNECDRLIRQLDAWRAGAAATPISD